MTTSSPSPAQAEPSLERIQEAALRAVAYADVFEFPLLAGEVHRYLHGVAATREATARALRALSAPRGALAHADGHYTLPGREALVDLRRRRAAAARQLWPAAIKYGRMIAGLPFARMVAVTGSLAWDNVDRGADIDYLIVTEPDRLWLCRWLVAALGRLASRDGVSLCPNYMVSERALLLAERNLYGAYELARMIPIVGHVMYRRLRRANSWALAHLPNAVDVPRPAVPDAAPAPTRPAGALVGLARLGEKTLRSPVGTLLERCEMTYRIYKRAKEGAARGEVSYGVDWYKAHVSGHRQRALAAFGDRLRTLGAGAP
jgi:hypothetical protein